MFSYVSPERRIPPDHPLRSIKAYADQALAAIGGELNGLYATTGRPSIAPERLLKGQLLIALYSIRSDRSCCEQLDYNLLYRWFLDMSMDAAGLDQSNFSRLRERLVASDVAGGPPPKDGGDGTGMVDFKGERRTNATHESTTDPEARLMRRGFGQPARLSFAGHALMDNRAGLCADFAITDARLSEPAVAAALIARQRRKRVTIASLGADKGYCHKAFVRHLRAHDIRPHLARIESRYTPGLDARTTRHESYRLSQRKRKRIEEIFGWLKTVGGLRKSRFIGIARTPLYAYLAASAYHLLRMARLVPLAT